MQFVEVSVEPEPSATSALQRRLDSSDEIAREELLTWRMSRDLVLNQLVHVHGDRAVYEAALAEAPEVIEYDLHDVEDGRFYAYIQERDAHETRSWWTVFLEYDFIHVPPVVVEDGTATVTLLGEFAELQGVVDDLSDAVSVTVEALGEYHGRERYVTDRLTERQYRALRAAADLGYYEVPRSGSIADVAAALECSESTASDLLRRAEREIVYALCPS